MTGEQRAVFSRLLNELMPVEFHHGDCIGADEEAHALVMQRTFRVRTVCHPPTDPSKRAFTLNDETYVKQPYLTRNREIVLCSHLLIATPATFLNVTRSGTWATVRFANSENKPVTVIYPDGSVEREYA